jgi:hypothetical protein
MVDVSPANSPHNFGGDNVFTAGRDAVDRLASIRNPATLGASGIGGLSKLSLGTEELIRNT